ncbi:MAG: hypothetical protein ACI4JT_05410 [Oscillospiraceae bacterium]
MNAAVNVANGCGQRQMAVNTAAMVAENRDRARLAGANRRGWRWARAAMVQRERAAGVAELKGSSRAAW